MGFGLSKDKQEQKKVREICRILERLYPNPKPPLAHKDPFTLLIAVLLSAQCTDERVNKVTPILFALASSPYGFAQLQEEDILPIIRSCGLGPQKSRAIIDLSRILVNEHNGQVPTSLEGLQKLPGVGRKTASVVLVQAFGVPAFPVDTHIHRLAKRWGLSSGQSVLQTERDLSGLVPQSLWGKLHLQMIYYGREYCTARHHSLERCAICRKFGASHGAD